MKKIDLTSLLHSFAALTAITLVFCTSTSMRTISRILKISPGTQSPSAGQDVVNTGKKASDWIDTKRPVTAKSTSSILAERTMYPKPSLRSSKTKELLSQKKPAIFLTAPCLILSGFLTRKKCTNWRTQKNWTGNRRMFPSVWVCAVTCLVTKHRNVLCLTATQTCILQNLCSTSPR